MNILITGVAGFVGSTLARVLLRDAPETRITGIDNLSFGYLQRIDDLRDRITFVEADVADLGRVLEGQRFDLIVHAAAIAPLPECQIDSHRALVQNVAMCGAVADFASRTGSRDIILFSSGAIYEGITTFPTPEDIPIVTRLVYPTSKYLAEQYFQAMCRSHALNVTAIRLFNLYGPHQDYFRKQPPLIGYLLANLIRDTEATLFSTGEQCRDYVYIDDLLDLVRSIGANMKALPKGGVFRAVNAGSGVPVSVNTMISTLERLAGRTLKIRRMPPANYWDKYDELFQRAIPLERSVIEQEVVKHTHASTEYARTEFGWRTSVSIERGLQDCLDHARHLLGSSNT